MQEQLTVTYGLCECGCGERTRIADRTHRPAGQTRGEPLLFINGHNSRLHPREYEVRDCGYETPCWVWLRYLDPLGYGHTRREDRSHVLAHVLVWERHYGPVPDGLELDHLCRNHPCVNPAHLEPVTHAENMRRGARAKLGHNDVQSIRASTDDALTLAHRYGVSRATIYSIRLHHSWKDV